MLSIVVVDKTAEARNRSIARLHAFLQGGHPELDLLPRINVKPVSVQELRFHECPDICIIGNELVAQEMTEVGKIKNLLPHTALIAELSPHLSGIAIIEQLARMGVNDTISVDTTAQEFFRKVVLLSRQSTQKKDSRLIVVDSGKGGVGVTSVVAGIGEKLLLCDKQVALVDFDFETQDLSRFLQAKPFVNESLQLMIEESRPVTEEFVEQALVPVWSNEERLQCMSPAPESEDLYDARSSYSRTFISIFEILDAKFDAVIVDAGSARGALLRTLYRVADSVIFVINNDPATLYASADRLSKARTWMTPGAELLVADNASTKHGLSRGILRNEFSRAVQLEDRNWFPTPIPFNARAARWPGSGATMAGLARAGVDNGFAQIITRLGFSEGAQSKTFLDRLKWSKSTKQASLQRQETAIVVPESPEEPTIALLAHDRHVLNDTTDKERIAELELVNAVEKPVLSERKSDNEDIGLDLDDVVSAVAIEDEKLTAVGGKRSA